MRRIARVSRTACRRPASLGLAACIASTLGACALGAQGALSMQGFGYPGGQLSTRALGVGGALADFDANSPINPASLAIGVRGVVYVQYDPEFRSVRAGAGRASSTIARFPVLGVTGRFGNATFGLSFSSLLDRTWTNVYSDTQTVGGRVVESNITAQSSGGISDARAAVSYRLNERLHVGLGLHVFPGQNRTVLGRDFADSLQIGSFTQASAYNFSGSGASLGVIAIPISHLNLAASARFGGTMTMRLADSAVVGSARVPNRWSLAAAYDGYAGSAISLRYVHEQWTGLRGLGSAGLAIADATELAGGVEFAGPKISGLPVALRLGVRSRDLPFAFGTQKVAEQSFAAGVGVPLASGRGAADIAVSRAHRTAGSLTETGWILSFGFAIKP